MRMAVVGLGFGDEGKGHVVSELCKYNNIDFVARFSGGCQAGHTVWKNSKKYIFSHLGSGTLDRVPTFWEKSCPVYIKKLVEEIEEKKDLNPNIFIDKKCPVTTEFDIYSDSKNHFTCGWAVGKTKEREEKKYHLSIEDLFFENILKWKLDEIGAYYKGYYEKEVSIKKLDQFKKLVDKNIFIVSENICEDKNIVYESSQGVLLDQDHGVFPYVTRSSVIPKRNIDKWVLVTRCYLTKHGIGPFFENDIDVNNIDETNVYNEFQGNFRISSLRYDLLEYAFSKIPNYGEKNIVVTCIDQVANGIDIVNNIQKLFKNKIENIFYTNKNDGKLLKA